MTFRPNKPQHPNYLKRIIRSLRLPSQTKNSFFALNLTALSMLRMALLSLLVSFVRTYATLNME